MIIIKFRAEGQVGQHPGSWPSSTNVQPTKANSVFTVGAPLPLPLPPSEMPGARRRTRGQVVLLLSVRPFLVFFRASEDTLTRSCGILRRPRGRPRSPFSGRGGLGPTGLEGAPQVVLVAAAGRRCSYELRGRHPRAGRGGEDLWATWTDIIFLNSIFMKLSV